MASSVRHTLAVTLDKCRHVNETIKIITSYPSASMFTVCDVFADVHPSPIEKGDTVKAMGTRSTTSVGFSAPARCRFGLALPKLSV